MDFYRVVEKKSFLGFIPYKKYPISRIRIAAQVVWMNFWYQGRVDFILGDIYEIDDEFYLNPDLNL